MKADAQGVYPCRGRTPQKRGRDGSSGVGKFWRGPMKANVLNISSNGKKTEPKHAAAGCRWAAPVVVAAAAAPDPTRTDVDSLPPSSTEKKAASALLTLKRVLIDPLKLRPNDSSAVCQLRERQRATEPQQLGSRERGYRFLLSNLCCLCLLRVLWTQHPCLDLCLSSMGLLPSEPRPRPSPGSGQMPSRSPLLLQSQGPPRGPRAAAEAKELRDAARDGKRGSAHCRAAALGGGER